MNSDRRLREVRARYDRRQGLSKVKSQIALENLGLFFGDPLQISRTAGIGSPRASLEANFALRTLVGPTRFFSGMSDQEARLVRVLLNILKKGPAPSASLRDVEQADAVLVLGEDVTQTAPRLALSVRQAAKKGFLSSATFCRSRLDDAAARTLYASPEDIARLGFAIAHELDPSAPPVEDLSQEAGQWVKSVTQTLLRAKRPVVISGISAGSEDILHAVANITRALSLQKTEVRVCLLTLEPNQIGLGLMEGRDLSELFEAMGAGPPLPNPSLKTSLKTAMQASVQASRQPSVKIDTLIILENDLFRRASSEAVSLLMGQAKRVILLDSIATPMVLWADTVLPAATLPEGDGTFVSYETRAQRAYRVFVPAFEEGVEQSATQSLGAEKTPIQESWRWLGDVLRASGRNEAHHLTRIEGVLADLIRIFPVFKPIEEKMFTSKNQGSRQQNRTSTAPL